MGRRRLAAFVSSVSDIDDLIPCLTAFQIEWNKLHWRLTGTQLGHDLAEGRALASTDAAALTAAFGITDEDLGRLRQVWERHWDDRIRAVAAAPLDLRLRSLASGFNDYRKAVEVWWDDLARTMGAVAVESQPIYFVSSNPHSLPNLISGHALSQRDTLVAFARAGESGGVGRRVGCAGRPRRRRGAGQLPLLRPTRRMENGMRPRSRAWARADADAGIHRFDEPHSLDISAQVIEICRLDPGKIDPRLAMPGLEALH